MDVVYIDKEKTVRFVNLSLETTRGPFIGQNNKARTC